MLPQGISTFNSGFKKYYKQIIEGDVMVLSTFHPKANWSVGYAMARNPIIYGLATEIFVAESSNKGGTWSGVVDGLKKGRELFVRKPEFNEANANNQLIQMGAVPVDTNGTLLSYEQQIDLSQTIVSEQQPNDLEYRIFGLLKKGTFTSKAIIDTLKLDWSSRKVSAFLKTRDEIVTIVGKPLKFSHKEHTIQSQKTLFD